MQYLFYLICINFDNAILLTFSLDCENAQWIHCELRLLFLEQGLAVTSPIEEWAGIGLSSRRNVLMSDNIGQRIAGLQCLRERGKSIILGRLEWREVRAFEFDAN